MGMYAKLWDISTGILVHVLPVNLRLLMDTGNYLKYGNFRVEFGYDTKLSLYFRDAMFYEIFLDKRSEFKEMEARENFAKYQQQLGDLVERFSQLISPTLSEMIFEIDHSLEEVLLWYDYLDGSDQVKKIQSQRLDSLFRRTVDLRLWLEPKGDFLPSSKNILWVDKETEKAVEIDFKISKSNAESVISKEMRKSISKLSNMQYHEMEEFKKKIIANTTQQSVQRIFGSRRDLQAFFWLQVFSALRHCLTPPKIR